MTRVTFSSVGNTPVVNDRLKMCVKGRTIWLHEAFIIFDVIVSQPGLPSLSRWTQMFITSSWVFDNNNDCKWRPPGIYLVQGILLARFGPIFTKNGLNEFDIIALSVTNYPLNMNLGQTYLLFLLFMSIRHAFRGLILYSSIKFV